MKVNRKDDDEVVGREELRKERGGVEVVEAEMLEVIGWSARVGSIS